MSSAPTSAESAAQHLPDGVLGSAIGLGKARRVGTRFRQRFAPSPCVGYSLSALGSDQMRILITGAPVSSVLALVAAARRAGCACALRQPPPAALALPPSPGGGGFVHGDVRCADDRGNGRFSLLLDCSAGPSVRPVMKPGVWFRRTRPHQLPEAARRSGAIFLSTSRVYQSNDCARALRRQAERLEIPDGTSGTGWSAAGLSAEFRCPASDRYAAPRSASEL